MIDFIHKYPIESVAAFAPIFPLVSMLYRMDYLDRVMRFLFFMICFKILIEGTMFWMAFNKVQNLWLSNLSVISSYCFIARMFYEAYSGKQYKSFVKYASIVFIFVYMLDTISVGYQYSLKYSYTVECLFVMLFCLLYYYELIQSLKIPHILTFPFFWVCSAFLIYYSTLCFISPFYYYLDQWHSTYNLHVFNTISYLFETFYLIVIGGGILLGK